MTIGERIKELRINRDMTQLELANALFVTDRAISKWEQGRGNPDLSILPNIASFFGVSIDYLLTGKDREPNKNDLENEIISYFESVVGQEITNEYLQRNITKFLDQYSVSKIKDALDICYDSYLIKKEKPLNIEDIKEAIGKLGGILYNNELPVLERTINRLLSYLAKNSHCPTLWQRKNCESELYKILELYNKSQNPEVKKLNIVQKVYKMCIDGKFNLSQASMFFREMKREIEKRKNQKPNDIVSDNTKSESYAFVGCEVLKISQGACKLIKGFKKSNYAVFTKVKKDRIFYVGLRFEESKSDNSYILEKTNDAEFGAIIYASDLLKTLYGEEAKNKEYTKHEVVLDPNNPNTLVIYNNYKRKYYIFGDETKKPIKSKHINTIVDGAWKVLSSKSKTKNNKKAPSYLLRNVETGEEIEISSRALFDIEKGLTTINNIKTSREIGVNTYRGIQRAKKKKKLKELHSADTNEEQLILDSQATPREMLSKKEIKEISNEELTNIRKTKLYKELSEFRKEYAKDKGIPSFNVASDRMLAGLVLNKPRNEKELSQCYGFRKKRIKEIGEFILKILLVNR